MVQVVTIFERPHWMLSVKPLKENVFELITQKQLHIYIFVFKEQKLCVDEIKKR